MGVDVCVKDCDPASELAVYIGVDIVLLFYQLTWNALCLWHVQAAIKHVEASWKKLGL